MNFNELIFDSFKEDDAEFVYETKRQCYEKYVDEFFGGWDERVQREMFDAFLKEEYENINIIKFNGERIGFINGKNISKDEYAQGNICLIERFRGMGIGTHILKNIIDSHKGQKISLRVFKSNPARHLYEKLGFTVTGETNSHFLMERKMIMNIFVSHSTSFDFKNELYKPLLELAEEENLNFILPEFSETKNTKERIKNADIFLAEVSFASTGSGIEIGWAESMGVPICCIYKKGLKFSSSLKFITDDFIEYLDEEDLKEKLKMKLKN